MPSSKDYQPPTTGRMEPHCPEYDELAEVIKANVTLREYLNMGDKGRRELLEDMTTPEPEEE